MAGKPVCAVAVIPGYSIGIGLLVIEVQEHDGYARLGDLPVIGLGRLTQQDQPVRVAGSQQVRQGKLLFHFCGQNLQQAEMSHILQLFNQPLAEDRVIGIRFKVLIRNEDADLHVLREDDTAVSGILVSHLPGFLHYLGAKLVAHARLSGQGFGYGYCTGAYSAGNIPHGCSFHMLLQSFSAGSYRIPGNPPPIRRRHILPL